MNFENINNQFRNCKLKIYMVNSNNGSLTMNSVAYSKTQRSGVHYHFFKANLAEIKCSISIQQHVSEAFLFKNKFLLYIIFNMVLFSKNQIKNV